MTSRRRPERRVRPPALRRGSQLILMAILGVMVVASGAVLGHGYWRSTTGEESVRILSYTRSASFDCTVYLLPNNLYDVTSLGPGETIFDRLVDHIDATFYYNFHGSGFAVIDGTYTVVADIQTSDWKKSVVLIPSTPFTTEGNSLSTSQDFAVDLASLDGIVSTIESETGVAARDTKVVITGMADASVSTGGRTTLASTSATMTIPRDSASYQIEVANSGPQTGSITATEIVARQSVHNERRYSLIALIMSLVALALVSMVPTKVLNEVESQSEYIQRVTKANRKKYGDRLATVTQIVQPRASGTVVQAGSLKELVRIADEIGKPVLLKEPGDPRELPMYYVIDGATLYQWEMLLPSLKSDED